MRSSKFHQVVKVIFSIFMIISAIGELAMNETVVSSMDIIGMPIYLLYLLGSLKILGVLAIWTSPYIWIKEWAYAGFAFDFIGAIFSFIFLSEFPFPDIIMAPIALLLCIITYSSWKKQQQLYAVPNNM